MLGTVLSLHVFPALLVIFIIWSLYTRTTFGRKSLAVGANQAAAKLSGIRVTWIVIASFALSGLLSSVAALLEVSRVAAALPTIGNNWLLTAFIIPILGGTSLKGGNVSVGGAIVAAIFLASISAGLISVGVPTFWQQLVLGAILLLTVIFDVFRRREKPTTGSHDKNDRVAEMQEGV